MKKIGLLIWGWPVRIAAMADYNIFKKKTIVKFPEYLHTLIYNLAKLTLYVFLSDHVNACISEFDLLLSTFIQRDCTRNSFGTM